MQTTERSNRIERGFYVGEYLVEPTLQRVTAGDRSVQVEPKVMEVLLVLAENHDQPVSKQQFLSEVWGGTVVTEDALLRCISELRKVFGDDPRDPSYIETIRKRGYRLIAPIRERAESIQTRSLAKKEVAWPTIWLAVSATALATLVLIWILQPERETLPARPLSAVPLTSYPGEETDPNFSPDGERVAFVWDGGGQSRRDVYITRPGSATPVQFTFDDSDDFSPTWMPDGEQVVYVRGNGGLFRVMVKPIAAGTERELASFRAQDISDATLSPDGQTLAVSVREEGGGPYVITLVDLATGNRTVPIRPPSDYLGDRHAAFSPSGEAVAFVRSVAEKVDDLFIQRLDTSPERRITSDNAEITGLDWSGDGAHLIFSSNREGVSALWKVPASGGDPVWMPISTEGSAVTQISVAGGRIAVVVRSEETNLWSMPIGPDSAAATSVVASTRMDGDPDISPDNRRLAFISNRMGHYEVWISNRDGSNPIQLTELGGPFTSTPRWGPAGERIAFVGRSEGHIDVYFVDVPGGRVKRVTTAGSNDRQPQWSRDGNWIYFASNRAGDWDIWKRPVDGGEPERVTRHGGFSALESINGDWVYFVKRNEPGIWKMPAGGGEEEIVVPGFEPYDWGNWTLDENGLYYVDRSGREVRLMHLTSEGSQPTSVARFDQLPKEPSLSVAPDGRSLVYTRLDRRGSDIMLIETN